MRVVPAGRVRIGVDVVDVERFRAVVARRPRLVERVFTAAERSTCNARADPVVHLAARFAVKEAVRKALGRAVPWQDVETRSLTSGAPVIALGDRARRCDGRQVGAASVSISHDGGVAMACVVVELE